MKNAAQKNGIARYIYPDGSQIILQVKSGLPVEIISGGDNASINNLKSNVPTIKTKNIEGPGACLSCGTARCYKTAKDACDGSADCKSLCDGLDWVGGWCTAAIGISCFVYNNG